MRNIKDTSLLFWAFFLILTQIGCQHPRDLKSWKNVKSATYWENNPMNILQDTTYFTYLDNPKILPQIRKAIQAKATLSQGVMVRPDEPGARIQIRGQIVDEDNNEGISGVSIELIQTDESGKYGLNELEWNPRIFGYFRTDDSGYFSVETLFPGVYLDDEGQPVPPHIHFNLTREGFRPYSSEFQFETYRFQPLLSNEDELPKALEIDTQVYAIELFLQPE